MVPRLAISTRHRSGASCNRRPERFAAIRRVSTQIRDYRIHEIEMAVNSSDSHKPLNRNPLIGFIERETPILAFRSNAGHLWK